MATPEINRLSTQTTSELKEFHTLTFIQEGGTQAQSERLQQALNSSPLLAKNINSAISKGIVEGFRIDKNPNNNGSYSPTDEMIRFNPKILNDRTDEGLGNLVFVTAHETQHSLDKVGEDFQKTKDSINRQAQQQGRRDYTGEVKAHVLRLRKAEALAEIDGFNAVVDMVRQTNPKPTLKQIYHAAPDHMHDFIKEKNGNYTLKSNLQLDKNMYLPINDKNIEAMGKNFFDKTEYFAIDYPDRYAAYAIKLAASYEQHYHGQGSKIRLNMKELGKIGIDEESLKEAGVDFNGIETAPNQSPSVQNEVENPLQARLNALQGKLDRAADAYGRNAREAICASQDEMIALSPKAQQVFENAMEQAAAQRLQREEENRRFSLENLPERAQLLHAQIDAGLRDYYRENNLPYTEREMKNSVAALTAQAYANRMPEIGHVGINKDGELFAWHETSYHYATHALADSAKAAATPQRESFAQTLEADQVLAEQDRRREYERQMEQHHSHSMSR
ncbi:XVIPCD domain-containing protein [Neisseria sp. CCUG12390]|uniref:XVIPCD domain-containing protein n=1 Tax=Neisseria sp. CCUG12390 TaxID=3392035 RepID=UPI003A102048